MRTTPQRVQRRAVARQGRRTVGALAIVAAVTAATMGGGMARPDSAGATTTVVEPSSTGVGIAFEPDAARHHRVVVPDGPRAPHLVVMLGGSNVAAGGYSDFTAHAAELGYVAINLSYPNRGTIGAACQATQAAERCFEQARGEIVFGAGVPDPNGDVYSSDRVSVDAANSISGRLVALIDHLAVEDPSWNRFLVEDASSPYTAAHRGPVRLKHQKLILAGHSQGGGHAAFLAMQVPVERVVMLGSPDDTTQSGTAPWIGDASATSLDRFWGLRHQTEGPYGQNIARVWGEIGGLGVGAGDNTSEVGVGDGSGDPAGSHRLVLTEEQATVLSNHMSTAYDGSYLAGVPEAWTYLLTGDEPGPSRGKVPAGHASSHS